MIAEKTSVTICWNISLSVAIWIIMLLIAWTAQVIGMMLPICLKYLSNNIFDLKVFVSLFSLEIAKIGKCNCLQKLFLTSKLS
jgi:hypothetical protein